MTNKLNLLAVEKYSKSFAAKICDEFFSTNSIIDGKQILSLTSFQQVNLFTAKALYEKWQTETQRLRSPYFNYNEPEVQGALKRFMNTLSQFIAVKRDAFEPLLVKATQETLWLILQPHKFFSENFRDLPSFRLTQDELSRLGKFVQINKNLLPPLAEKLNGAEFVFANQAIEWLDEIIAKTPQEDPEQYLDILSDILPVPVDIFAKKNPEVADFQQLNGESGNSFFDTLLQNDNSIGKEKPAFEPIVLKPKAEVKEEVYTEPVVPFIPAAKEEIKQEEPKYIIEETPKSTIAEQPPVVETPKVQPKETEDIRLNDHLGTDQKTLNDKVSSGTTVLDMHKTRKIEDINHAISLNQRFLFINNLFQGNAEAYNNAIQELGSCQNFIEAKEVLLKKYVPKYLWDITSAEAEEFIDIVRRRFN